MIVKDQYVEPISTLGSTKKKVIDVIQKRINIAFSDGCHNYEGNRLVECIYYINCLIPPEDFEDIELSK